MATPTLRPKQIQELDLTLERERHWLVEHIGALQALRGGTAGGARFATTAPAITAIDTVAHTPDEADRFEELPALHALVEALTTFVATELAPEDTRDILDRVYHERLD